MKKKEFVKNAKKILTRDKFYFNFKKVRKKKILILMVDNDKDRLKQEINLFLAKN